MNRKLKSFESKPPHHTIKRTNAYARFGVLVAALVKIGEETEEEDAVASDPPNKGLGVVAIDEEQLERVHHNGDELNLMAA